jgi:hypothetical protein
VFRYKHSCESQLLITTHNLSRQIKGTRNTRSMSQQWTFPRPSTRSRMWSCWGNYTTMACGDPWLHWTETFLKNRHKQVVVDGAAVQSIRVMSGVPQGTVFGPHLLMLLSTIYSTMSHQRYGYLQMIIYSVVSYEAFKTTWNIKGTLTTWSNGERNGEV